MGRDFDRKRNVVRIAELAKPHFYKTFPTPTENLMNKSIQKGLYANLHKYISHAIRKGYLLFYFQFIAYIHQCSVKRNSNVKSILPP